MLQDALQVFRLSCRLVDARHALVDDLVLFPALLLDHLVVRRPHGVDEAAQLMEAGVVVHLPVLHEDDGADAVELRVGILLVTDVVHVDLHRALEPHALLEEAGLRIEEVLHVLQVVEDVVERVDVGDQGIHEGEVVVPLLEDGAHDAGGLLHFLAARIMVVLVPFEQHLVMALLLAEVLRDEVHEAVLVLRDAHHFEVFLEELRRFLDLRLVHLAALGDGRLADLRALAEVVDDVRVVRAHRVAGALQRHRLLPEQLADDRRDVDLAPTIRNRLVAALDLRHRRLHLHLVAHLEVRFHVLGGLLVLLVPRERQLALSADDVHDVLVRVDVLRDVVELAVLVLDEVFERLVDLRLRVARFRREVLAVHIILAERDGLADVVHHAGFQLARLVLLHGDEGGDLARLCLADVVVDVLADLHRFFHQREVRRIGGKGDDGLPLGLTDERHLAHPLHVGRIREERERHPLRHLRADDGGIHLLLEREVIDVVAVFRLRVDVGEDEVADAVGDLRRGDVLRHDLLLHVLLLVRQELEHVARASDIVLLQQAVEGLLHLRALHDLVHVDVVGHEDHDVVRVRRHVVLDVADEVQALQDGHVVGFEPLVVLRRLLAAVDDAADAAVEERHHRVVEAVERRERRLVPVLYLLRDLLEAGKHGALAAREVLARVAVLADFVIDLLQEQELIRDERIIDLELNSVAVRRDIRLRVLEHEQVLERRRMRIVDAGERGIRVFRLGEDAALDDLVHGGRREGEARLEAGHDAGELVLAHLDDLVERFLPCRHDPDLALALAAELLDDGLEVEEHVAVGADVLADLVNHEEEAVVVRLLVDVRLDLPDEMRDAELLLAAGVEPVARGRLAHPEDLHHRFDDLVLVEGERVAGFLPAVAELLLECALEVLELALLREILLEAGGLQVFAVKAEMVVEHLREHAEHGRLVLVAGPLDVDVEEDGLRLALRGLVDELVDVPVVGELPRKRLLRAELRGLPAVEEVRQDLQEVGFTASEEAGDPYADVSRRLAERLAVGLEERLEMLLQLLRDDILVHLLADDVEVVLVDLDDAVDGTVYVLLEHLLDFHDRHPFARVFSSR